jgi:signal peptidase I
VATLRTIVAALALALLLRVVLYQPFTIPSASMEPGLVEGDYILVSKFSYGWSRASIPFSPPLFPGRVLGRAPDRGDVIVFKSGPAGTAVIKRVVGLPGDRIQVRGGEVLVNGRALPQTALARVAGERGPAALIQERMPEGRSYLTLDRGSGREGDDTDAHRVPADSYFVMGDNRDDSLDSRWPLGMGMGYVPAEAVVGEAQLILLSWDAGASLFKPWTWFSLQTDRLVRRIS